MTKKYINESDEKMPFFERKLYRTLIKIQILMTFLCKKLLKVYCIYYICNIERVYVPSQSCHTTEVPNFQESSTVQVQGFNYFNFRVQKEVSNKKSIYLHNVNLRFITDLPNTNKSC